MSVKAWWDTWCDEDGCLIWVHGGPSRAEAVSAARRAGWRQQDGLWLCPRHLRRKASPLPAGDRLPVEQSVSVHDLMRRSIRWQP